MGSVNLYCKRIIEVDGTVKVKKCRYYDPKDKLKEYRGRTLLIENPHNIRHIEQGHLGVYTKDRFYITKVIPMPGEKPGPIPKSCQREYKKSETNSTEDRSA